MDADELLYKRVKEGDMVAFDELYGRYETRLFSFILRMVHLREDAEDLFHEAFLQVLKSREVRFDQASFRTWLYRVARNLCLNHLRSGRRKEAARHGMDTAAAPSASAEERLEARELSNLLSGAVSKLPPALSEIYHLRSLGLSYDEMASVLEVPLGTVKSRMSQMVSQLRTDVSPWIF